jgi:bifunctional non-homologous end joining protein LigD
MASQLKQPAATGVKALFPNFTKPCLPTKVTRPPSGSLWVHEIKHDGYRLIGAPGR